MERSAGFSRCGRYRYWLSRQWERQRPHCLFIGLNPSTADAREDDPTLRRIMGFSKAAGFGGVVVVNLFAVRATDPRVLTQCDDPVGPRNNYWLGRQAANADRLVAAWGNGGILMQRDQWVLQHRRVGTDLWCLGHTRLGQPRHPLYVPKHTVLKRFSPQ